MIMEILKGFVIGVCASAPIGPIAILVIQKTLSQGQRAGFIAGLGACLVDTIYAIIALFALAFVQDFIATHENIILIVGGIVVAVMGVSMTFADPFRKLKSQKSSSISFKDFAQSVAMGFSNPGAILVIFALFAFFGLGDQSPKNWSVAPLLLSVSAGAALYWFVITYLLNIFRKRFTMKTIVTISRLTGLVIIIIGIVTLFNGLFNVIFIP